MRERFGRDLGIGIKTKMAKNRPMSINLTRRDALRGAMAAGAAIAAAPYLLNLTGGVESSPIQNVPVKANAVPASAATSGLPAQADSGTTVLVIKGDVVKSYSGLRTIMVQDAALAAKLKTAVLARYD
jgi:hypothetical protein